MRSLLGKFLDVKKMPPLVTRKPDVETAAWNDSQPLVLGRASPRQTTDRQKLNGFIWHNIREGYCVSDVDIAGIIDQADEKLFQLVLTNPNHVLSVLLADKTNQCCHLRARHHDRQLVDKSNTFFSNHFTMYNDYNLSLIHI